jgi:hypothetical protein
VSGVTGSSPLFFVFSHSNPKRVGLLVSNGPTNVRRGI